MTGDAPNLSLQFSQVVSMQAQLIESTTVSAHLVRTKSIPDATLIRPLYIALSVSRFLLRSLGGEELLRCFFGPSIDSFTRGSSSESRLVPAFGRSASSLSPFREPSYEVSTTVLVGHAHRVEELIERLLFCAGQQLHILLLRIVSSKRGLVASVSSRSPPLASSSSVGFHFFLHAVIRGPSLIRGPTAL